MYITDEINLDKLREIHERHYQEEFDFPDFSHKYLSVLSIYDDNDTLVSAGGIRSIAESVIITDKCLPRRTRIKALQIMHEVTSNLVSKLNYKEFHVFIEDGNYEQQLIKSGFVPTKGKCLVYKV